MDIGTVAGFVLTLMVFSYLLGDNFLYRIAIYIFVGLAAAYITIATFEGVIFPLLVSSNRAELILLIVAGIFSLLLLFKGSARLAGVSNIVIAVIVAVGASVSILGAVSGTLLPLSISTADMRGGVSQSIIVFVGVATSLIYFQYLARRLPDGTIKRGPVTGFLSTIGQGFIVITLGAVYGAAILTSLTILTERIGFLFLLGAS